MEEYKEEPGSGEGRDEVDIVNVEPDANTPDVGNAVTAECHSERELNVINTNDVNSLYITAHPAPVEEQKSSNATSPSEFFKLLMRPDGPQA